VKDDRLTQRCILFSFSFCLSCAATRFLRQRFLPAVIASPITPPPPSRRTCLPRFRLSALTYPSPQLTCTSINNHATTGDLTRWNRALASLSPPPTTFQCPGESKPLRTINDCVHQRGELVVERRVFSLPWKRRLMCYTRTLRVERGQQQGGNPSEAFMHLQGTRRRERSGLESGERITLRRKLQLHVNSSTSRVPPHPGGMGR
jgi:hypothetical protein